MRTKEGGGRTATTFLLMVIVFREGKFEGVGVKVLQELNIDFKRYDKFYQQS